MPSNLNYDPKLLQQAKELGNFQYKTDAVNAALTEYVQRHQQPKIIEVFGKIEYNEDYDEDYDYKNARKR